MSRSNAQISVPAAIAVGAIAVIAVIASGVLRDATAGVPTPSGPPPASPSAPASPVPSDDPADYPDDFSDGNKTVKLDIATDHDIFVMVDDEMGRLINARTGRAGDGMSVRWGDMKVENVGPSTLRLTWVGFAADDKLVLVVGESIHAKVNLTLVQVGPPPNSDATGYDRVLVLEFGSPVSAADVEYSIRAGLDTAG
jgi:hypothetical protein